MLQFPENYFKREMKDGFVVSEVMKRVWAASLEVLQKVVDICEKYDMNYFLYWGTLLGTIRHKGFIPWDDDIDIVLTGEDYVKFLSVVKDELPEEYCVLNVYTTDGYTNALTRITNGNSIDTGARRMAEYHNCPFAVGVDVFPLYYIPRDEQCAEEQKTLLSIIEQLYRMLEHSGKMGREGAEPAEIQAYNEMVAKRILALQEVTGFRLEKGKNLKTQLSIMYDQICRLYTAEESERLTIFPYYLNKGYNVPKEFIRETTEMPFENMMLRVPVGYDGILRELYKDYMTPVRGGGEHTYVRGQMEDLLNRLCLEEINYDIPEDAGEIEALLPESWQEKLYFINEEGKTIRKTVVLYSPTWLDMLCNGGYSMEKLRTVLQTYEKKQDVILWWFVHPLKESANDILSKMVPELFEEYRQIVNEYQQADWGIYDDSGDAGRTVMMGDVYYGDKGELYSYFEEMGKETICQDYEATNMIEYER